MSDTNSDTQTSLSLSEVEDEASNCETELLALDECIQTLQAIVLKRGAISPQPDCLGDVPMSLVFGLLVNSVDTAVDSVGANYGHLSTLETCDHSERVLCELTSHCTPCQVETMEYAQCSYMLSDQQKNQRRRMLRTYASPQHKIRKRKLSEVTSRASESVCAFEVDFCPHYIASIGDAVPISNSTVSGLDNIAGNNMNHTLPPTINDEPTGASKSSGRRLLLATIIIAVIFLLDYILEKLQKKFHPTMANAAERSSRVINSSNNEEKRATNSDTALEHATVDQPHAGQSDGVAAQADINAEDLTDSHFGDASNGTNDMEQPIDRSSSRAEVSKPRLPVPPPPPFTEASDREHTTIHDPNVIKDIQSSGSTEMVVDYDDTSDFESIDSAGSGHSLPKKRSSASTGTKHERAIKSEHRVPSNGKNNRLNNSDKSSLQSMDDNDMAIMVDNFEMEQSSRRDKVDGEGRDSNLSY